MPEGLGKATLKYWRTVPVGLEFPLREPQFKVQERHPDTDSESHTQLLKALQTLIRIRLGKRINGEKRCINPRRSRKAGLFQKLNNF